VTRFIVFTVLFFATLVALTIIFLMPHPAKGGRIQEDDENWNCHTMGNRVCGVSESYRSRFDLYDRLFECFAEASYTMPKASWDSRVRRCIPDFD
jgi:hypothetical protein